jgi:trans-aconitate 2-methyltransferase
MSDWDPVLYERFQQQRQRPFLDLIDLLPPDIGGRWIDLGCGDGRLTQLAAERLGAQHVLGIDASESMLAAVSQADEDERFTWRQQTIEDATAAGGAYQLVLANASLQFLPDHEDVLKDILQLVAPGGWVAWHIPYNHIARTHLLAESAASSDDLSSAFEGFRVTWPQQRPEVYARMLKAAGFERSLVQLRTYRHAIDGTASMVAWMAGGALRPWLDALDVDHHDVFLKKYERLLGHAYPPYHEDLRLLDYTRLLLVAQRPLNG